MCGHFPILILTGRPAAGKSEVIDFLKKCDPTIRLEKYHIANFEELDDFVYVWETFELDDLMTRFGKPRVWSDEKYWFKEQYIWDLYIDRLALDYKKKILKDPMYHEKMTALVEFARGGDDAIHHALTLFSDEMLNKASLVYVKVPYKNHCARIADVQNSDRKIPFSIIRCRMKRWSIITRRMIGRSWKPKTRTLSM